MRPMTLFASGAESAVYLFRIACAAGSGVTSWVTIRLVAVAAVTALERSSIVRSMSVIRRPNDAALVTSLPDILQMYGWCVWALTITLTRGSSPAAICCISGPLKFTQRFTSVYSSPLGCVAGEAGGAGGLCAPPRGGGTTNSLAPPGWGGGATGAVP